MEHLDVAEGLESGFYEEVRETDGTDGGGDSDGMSGRWVMYYINYIVYKI